MTTLADDVARLRQVLAAQDGPTIVAGHSYGGQIMTALGTNAPNVAGLVYIAAFGIDEGESLGGLLAQGPVTPALQHLITDEQGFTWLSEDDFVNHFAADVDPVRARVMYAVQQALAASSFGDVMGVPAWKSQPAWYLVAANDEAIRRTPSASSLRAWARPPSRSRPATWRWCPTRTTWCSSSRPPPRRSRPPAEPPRRQAVRRPLTGIHPRQRAMPMWWWMVAGSPMIASMQAARSARDTVTPRGRLRSIAVR